MEKKNIEDWEEELEPVGAESPAQKEFRLLSEEALACPECFDQACPVHMLKFQEFADKVY